MEISPDLLRHIISFDNSSILCARCVCVNWSISLSSSQIEKNHGLESVNFNTYHDSYKYLMGMRTTRCICKNIKREFIKFLHNCSHLKKLSITGSFEKLDLYFPSLKYLDCNQVSLDFNNYYPSLLTTVRFEDVHNASSFNLIFKNCPLIKRLTLIRCYPIEKLEIKAIADYLPSLQSFEFQPCIRYAVRDLSPIAQSCKGLKRLKLVSCDRIRDGTVEAFARNCPDLEMLYISNCPWITDHILRFLLKQCSNIQCVFFYEMQISYKTLIKTPMPSLKRLVAITSRAVPKDFKKMFEKRHPNVKYIVRDFACIGLNYPRIAQPIILDVPVEERKYNQNCIIL
jgi:hypothetical protein